MSRGELVFRDEAEILRIAADTITAARAAARDGGSPLYAATDVLGRTPDRVTLQRVAGWLAALSVLRTGAGLESAALVQADAMLLEDILGRVGGARVHGE